MNIRTVYSSIIELHFPLLEGYRSGLCGHHQTIHGTLLGGTFLIEGVKPNNKSDHFVFFESRTISGLWSKVLVLERESTVPLSLSLSHLPHLITFAPASD